MNLHDKYMTRCLELAKNGLGSVYPNPMVGSVLVFEGEIIGEGWHQKAGGPHAEVRAISSVKNKKVLSEATLYVNLEPCSHFGKTPPCADLIIKNGIRKVVIGVVDSNKKVGGKGIERLRENGVEVIVPVMEKACRALNKRFFTYHEKKRPYVVLKWAQTKDKFIFPDDKLLNSGKPFWISNLYSRQRVHQWRAQEASILVGKITAQQDNPKLNVRDFVGDRITRIAIDRNLELSEALHLMDGSVETIIFNNVKDEKKGNLHFVKLNFSKMVVNQIDGVFVP